MKAIRVCICGLGLLMLLAQCALCAQIWTEEKIAGPNAGGAKMYDGAVYWTDSRNYSSGYYDIRKWTASGGESILLQVPKWSDLSAVNGDKLVYERYISRTESDLYTWDPVNGEQPFIVQPGIQTEVDMWGDRAVWADDRTGVSQIHIWDPTNGDRAIAPSGNNQITPKIYGDTVVWEEGYTDEWAGYMPSVYMWDPVNGKKLIGDGMRSPAIYGNKIAMFMPDSDPYSSGSLLYEYSISTGMWNGCTSANSRVVFETQMWGDLVVWSDYSGWSNVYAWDPVNGRTIVNQSDLGTAMVPSLYGRTVAWQGASGLYVGTLVPEPGSCCGLFLGLLCVGTALRWRTAA